MFEKSENKYIKMSKPLEITHQNFENKLIITRRIIDYLLSTLPHIAKICESKNNVGTYNTELNNISGILDHINVEYDNYTIAPLCNYFDASDTKLKCQKIEQYEQIMIFHNFPTKLNTIVQKLNEICSKLDIKNDTPLMMLFKEYHSISLQLNVKLTDYNICRYCNIQMVIDPHRSELRCNKCSYAVFLKGTIFNEMTFYGQDGISKRGSYETSRHCKYHLDRILATKIPSIPEDVWDKIRAWIKRNNFQYLKLISCSDYRRCLKDIKETTYNEYIPFIRQKISGVSPGHLFDHEITQLHIYFDKAVCAFNNIKSGERANLKYYPYFIYKIIEMILNEPVNHDRFKSIVECIHFQREDTIIANDKIWQEICNEVGFAFQKTDKNLL